DLAQVPGLALLVVTAAVLPARLAVLADHLHRVTLGRREPDGDHPAGQGVLLDAHDGDVEAVNHVDRAQVDDGRPALDDVQFVDEVQVVPLAGVVQLERLPLPRLPAVLRLLRAPVPFLPVGDAGVADAPLELTGADGGLYRHAALGVVDGVLDPGGGHARL